jgi:hypothetical protein
MVWTALKASIGRSLKLEKIYNRGRQESFDIPVRAEDPTLPITLYTVNIKMNWNPSIDSIAFPGAGKIFW